MHACTYTSLLEYMQKITVTAPTQSFPQCRMRMIQILLSQKASQTLNVSVLCAWTN